jgi:hypothetical protein
MRTFLLSLLLSVQAFGAVIVDKGQQAPYRGFLFTAEEEQALTEKMVELEADKKRIEVLMQQNKLYMESEKIYQEQVTLWRDQAHNLAKINAEKQNLEFWKQTFFFGLGALLTTAIVYGVAQAQK